MVLERSVGHIPLPAELEPLLWLAICGRQCTLCRALCSFMWREYGLGQLLENFGSIECGDNVTGQLQETIMVATSCFLREVSLE